MDSTKHHCSYFQYQFDRWEQIPGNPYEESAQQAAIHQVRTRKGLNEQIPTQAEFLHQ